MANIFSKQVFSTGASMLVVSGTDSAGATTIHTVPASSKDEIWLFATNNDVAAVSLTLEFPSGSAGNSIKQAIPASSGLTILVPGLILTSSQVVRAFATTSGQISLHGYINRIS